MESDCKGNYSRENARNIDMKVLGRSERTLKKTGFSTSTKLIFFTIKLVAITV